MKGYRSSGLIQHHGDVIRPRYDAEGDFVLGFIRHHWNRGTGCQDSRGDRDKKYSLNPPKCIHSIHPSAFNSQYSSSFMCRSPDSIPLQSTSASAGYLLPYNSVMNFRVTGWVHGARSEGEGVS